MKYSIGEFASLLGVTVDTIRLYEKYGIITPIKDHKNNYRYFSDLDARSLLMSRWYRSIQIPLPEAAALTKEAPLERIIDHIKEAALQLEEEIKSKTLLLNKMKEINDDFDQMETLLNQCKIKELPGIYRLKQTNKNILLQDDHLHKIVNAWMEALPYTFYSFRIEKKALLSQGETFDYSWGLAISEEEVEHFDLEIDKNVEYIAPNTYLTSVIRTRQEDYLTRNSVQFMLDFIKRNSYTIKGDVIGKIILTEKTKDKNNSYLEVNIPI